MEAPLPEKRPPALDGRQPSVYQRPMPEQSMRGFFAIGAEGISKPMNIGALLRTGHAFGAAFCFTVAPVAETVDFGWSDTSSAAGTVPLYTYPDVASLTLPQGCALVGIELMADSVALPSFRHPRRAVYVLGSERGGLSAESAICGG